MTKQCPQCGAVKPVDAFGADRSKPDGRMSHCRKCCNAARRARYHAAIERERKRSADYYAHNIERVRARNEAARARARAIYGGACAECGTDAGLEFHHPDGDGGEHRKAETMQQLCLRIARAGTPVTDRRLVLLCPRHHLAAEITRGSRDRPQTAARIAVRRAEVMRLRGLGWTRARIAAELKVHPRTVQKDNAANRQLARDVKA